MKIYVILSLSFLPYFLSALTLDPSTFTVSNLNTIESGTTIFLDAGTYLPDSSVLAAWASGVSGKDDVRFKPTGNGMVVFDGMAFAKQQRVRFTDCNNLRIENITLKNILLQFWECKNSTFDSIISKEQKFVLPEGENEKDYGKMQSLLALGYGGNCTISNCELEITFSDFSCKAIKSYRGTNHKFLNNTITGNLQGAYEIWSNTSQVTDGVVGYSGALVRGDYIERTVFGGSEDHGIYFHDVSDAMIDSCTIKGWSASAAGGAVKIKNANNVEVKNCKFYTSGVLLRTGSSGWQHCSNIYIHDNEICGGFALSTYMTPNAGYDNPEAIVFENNRLYDDGIVMKYSPIKFNQYSSRAGKCGGVYNNGYAEGGSFEIAKGVNSNRNYIIGSSEDPESGGSPSCSVSDIKPYMSVNNGSWYYFDQIAVQEGDNVTLAPQPNNGTYSWNGPNGFSSSDTVLQIKNIQHDEAGLYVATFTNYCGESTVRNFKVVVEQENTAINRAENEGFNVYPNPFTSALIIKNADKIEGSVSLLDVTGRVIYSKPIASENEVRIGLPYSQVPKGVFILRMNSGVEVKSIPIIRK